jgi:hypothetical protein
MKEDILEQLAEDYLQAQGYFTRTNLKFRPDGAHAQFVKKLDSNHSDIDVLGIHPTATGPKRVFAVSCKSWQSGLDSRGILAKIDGKKKFAGREAWKAFRELADPKWGHAFCAAVTAATGSKSFTYAIAVTKLRGTAADADIFCNRRDFRSSINGNKISFLTLQQMADTVAASLTTTMATSQLARTLQLLRAASWSEPAMTQV